MSNTTNDYITQYEHKLGGMNFYNVKSVFDAQHIPEYIWLPIMAQESGGNPNAHAKTSQEDSRGLFQINVKAHPQWKHVNLFDPVTNAKIAAANFIKPAYQKALSVSGLTKEQQAAYVWKNGIKPAWTTQKDQAIQQSAANVLKDTSFKASPIGGGVSDVQKKFTGLGSNILNGVQDMINGLLKRAITFGWIIIPLLLGLVLLILTGKSMFLDNQS